MSSARHPNTLRASGRPHCSPCDRSYVQNNYLDIKGKNPETPFIVRECLNAQPTVMARYDFGVEKRVYLNDLDEKTIDGVVRELVEQAKAVNAAIPSRF